MIWVCLSVCSYLWCYRKLIYYWLKYYILKYDWVMHGQIGFDFKNVTYILYTYSVLPHFHLCLAFKLVYIYICHLIILFHYTSYSVYNSCAYYTYSPIETCSHTNVEYFYYINPELTLLITLLHNWYNIPAYPPDGRWIFFIFSRI